MIKNVKQDDGLEEVKVKLNEVINVLIWENPMATVEKVAQKHLVGHNRQIAQTRDDLKTTLVQVQTALEKIDKAVKDQSEFKTSIEKDQSEFKTSIKKDQSEFGFIVKEKIESIFKQQKQFESKTEKDQSKFKTTLSKDYSEFKTSIEKDQSEFKTTLSKDYSEFKTTLSKDYSEFKTTLSKDYSEFKKSITEISNTLQYKIKQFITFYAQVGIHVKELCDGKK